MQKKQSPRSFLQRGYSEKYHAWYGSYLVRQFQVAGLELYYENDPSHLFFEWFCEALEDSVITQLTFTCSKSAKQTLEKVVIYVQI